MVCNPYISYISNVSDGGGEAWTHGEEARVASTSADTVSTDRRGVGGAAGASHSSVDDLSLWMSDRSGNERDRATHVEDFDAGADLREGSEGHIERQSDGGVGRALQGIHQHAA